MVSSEKSSKVLKNLQLKENNNQCIDCASTPTSFASVNFGIFLCGNCASTHRALLTPKFTYIKSLTEVWQVSELHLMHIGGNLALYKYLCHYGIQDRDAGFKYKTKAAEFYIKLLRKVKDHIEDDQQLLPIDEGRQFIDDIRITEVPFDYEFVIPVEKSWIDKVIDEFSEGLIEIYDEFANSRIGGELEKVRQGLDSFARRFY